MSAEENSRWSSASDKIYAPWPAEVVAQLNQYQAEGFFHPFTCGAGQAGAHAGGVSLVATGEGWHCPLSSCNYTQDWAWTFMARANHSER